MPTRRVLFSSTAILIAALLPPMLQGGNTFAAQLPYIAYYTGQPGVTARGMTFDPRGNLVFADTNNNAVFMRDKTVTYSAISPGAGISIIAGGIDTTGFPSGDGGVPTGAFLDQPTDVKYDPAGNLYIYESGNGRLRVVNYQATAQMFSGVTVQPGRIGTVVTGATGVTAIAIDATGKVYLAGPVASIFTPNGSLGLAFVFGSGMGGFAGDGGLATSPSVAFLAPSAMAFDNAGNLYIADAGNCVIRLINMTAAPITRFTLTIGAGDIQTVAGSPNACGDTDSTLALSRLGTAITSIAVDSVGSVYIADSSNRSVRFADRLSGRVSSIIGQFPLFPRVNTLAVDDAFSATSIALDPLDNLYAGAANNTYKVSTTNPVSQAIVGQSSAGTLAFLANAPLPNVVISSNNPAFVYHADATCEGQNLEYPTVCYVPITFTPSSPGLQTAQLTIGSDCAVVTIGVTGIGVGPELAIVPGAISTYAGNGIQSTGPDMGNGGPATAAELHGPTSVAFDGAGNMYIGDTDGAQVREVIASTGNIFTFAGSGTIGFTSTTSSPASAHFAFPGGVAVDASGNLFIAEQANNQVAEWNLNAGFLYSFIGNGATSSTGDGGPVGLATIDQPPSVTADLAGNLYIPDKGNFVRMVKAANGVVGGSVIVTIAGNGSPVFSGDGGLAIAAGMTPAQVALDTLGNLYIADSSADRIRKVAFATGIITTVAGNGSGSSSGDGGPALSAGIASPSGVAVDAAGNIYIADGAGLIRKVSVATGLIGTVAGNGSNQEMGDGGPATSAGIDTFSGQLAFDTAGNLYLAERNGLRIRKISIDSPTLQFGSVPRNSTSTAQSVQVVNNGNAPYSLAVLTVSAQFAEKAASAATDCQFTGDSIGVATLAPGQSCNLSLRFTPTNNGVQTGTAAFIGQSISLTGTGTNLATVTTFQSQTTSYTYGQTESFTVAVTSGGAPVTSGSVTFVDITYAALLSSNVGLDPILGTASYTTTNLAANTHNIAAFYSPSASYAPSNGMVQVTIATKALAVTATVSTPAGTYSSAAPTTAIVVTGFVNGDNSGNPLAIQPNTPISIGGAVTGQFLLTITDLSNAVAAPFSTSTPASTYTITPSGVTLTASNYSFNFVPVTYTVNKATLIVTPNSAAALYGTPIPFLSYQIAGFVNFDQATVVSGSAFLTTSANQGSPAGQYPTTPHLGSLSALNYSFSFINGQLTILKAMLTVTASPVSSSYGAAIPALPYIVNGFVDGDPATVVSGTPNVTTTATSSSALGQYPITVALGSLTAVNYNFSFTGAQLTIGKAMLTVTANPLSATYGAAIPTLTYAVTGFVNGDLATVVSGTPAPTTTAVMGSPVGPYPITAAMGSLSAVNYNFAFTGAQVTIGKATFTVSANSAVAVYGAAIPALTYQITGFVNGDLTTVVSGAATVTTTAIVGSAAGQYPVTAALGSLSAVNYMFAFSGAQLNIGKAMLTVAANATIAVYGAAIPTLTYQITGFVNSDLSTVVSGAPAIATTAIVGSATGQYPITVTLGSMSAINYNFAFTGAQVTVGKAMLTVTASPVSVNYGAAIPALAAAITGFANGDTASVVSGAAALVTTATGASATGQYPITVSQGTLSAVNYNFSFTGAQVTIGKATLTVTANPASTIYGTAIPALTYTIAGYVNGDPASVVSGAATVTTTAIVGSAAGQYGIAPHTGSLSAINYSFSFLNGQLTIGKAMLTVAANPASVSYGAAIPALTYAINGFVSGDTAAVVSGAPAIATTAIVGSATGQYPITVTLGSMSAINYNFAFTGAQVTVGKAMLTVTASPVSVNYGAAIPALTYSLNGLVNGDLATVVSGTATIGTTATGASATGQYPITVSQGTLSASNYNFTFTGSQVTIGKATLTVTANPASTIYGAAIPALTYTITGFVSGDLASVVSGTATVTTTAIVGSAAGQYSIAPHAGTLSAVNYSFSFLNGQLTIGKATLTVVANPESATYGAALPALTYAINGFVNGDTAVAVSGAPAIGTTATVGSATGQYPITVTVGTLSALNYNFTFSGAQVTIGKAMLTVTARPVSVNYGSAIPALTYSINGLVNGDAATVVSGAPVLTATATATSAIGQYPIAVSQGTLSASNYNFSFTGSQVTIGKATLTVTANPRSATYGAAIPPLTDTIAGFTGGDAATVVSGTAALTTTAIAGSAAGQYAITVGQGTLSASNYNFSFTGSQLTIAKAVAMVTANPASAVYGAAIPTLTYTINGLVNGDTAAAVSGTPAIGATAAAGSATGQYTITAGQGTLSAINYSFSFTNALLTIVKAMVTVAANPVSANYGGPIPALTYSINGLVNGDLATVVSGTPALTTTATSSSAVGQYAITAGLGALSAANYNFSFTGSQVTIGKATLTVTASPVSFTYGAAIPALTYTIGGFAGGDAATVVSGAPALTSSATASSAAGQYPIAVTQGTLAAANYNFSFAGSQVTIGKAALTVTANPVSTIYGSAIPAVTYTIGGLVNGDTAAAVSGTPALNTAATPSSAAGQYPIAVTLGTLSAANYNFSFAGSQVTIGKATLTVTANLLSAIYGAAIPGLTYTIAGFVNSDTATAVSGTPAVNTAATSSSAAGQYAITVTPGTLSSANYTFSFTGSQVTIGKATLALTAKTLSAIYGAGIPALTYALAGFLDGDTSAVVSGSPALTTSATASSAAGQYPITASQGTLSAANYNFSFTGSQVTIGKAMLTVTASTISVGYGAAFPVLTYTITGLVNGDTATAVTGVAALGTTATQGSAAGQYPITANLGSLSAANYTFTFTGAHLTIGMATSTVGAILTPGVSEPVGTSFTVTFSVPAVSGGRPPTGTLAYSVDGGTSQIVTFGLTGSAAIALPGLGVGSHSLSGAYSGDNNYPAAPAATVQITVTKAASSIVITPLNNGTANVAVASTTPTPSSPSPSGSVSCSLNGTAPVVFALSGSSATLTFFSATPGSYTISCSYGGDGNFTASGPVSAAIVIPKLNQSVTAITDFAGSSVPAGQAFTVIVSFTLPAGAATPTGGVTVSVNARAPQTAALSSGAATVPMAGLTAGAYTIAVTYTGDSNYSASTTSLNITATSTTPLVPTGGLESGALSTANLSPGSWATLFGGNLSVTTATAAQLPLTTSLGGASVSLNGEACPLDYVSPTQINFQVPYDIPVGLATVVVSTSAGTGAPFTATVIAAAPAVFTYIDSTGTSDPIVLHGATLLLVSASSPAQAGETLVLYATGAGPVIDQPASGAAAGAGATSVVTPTVTVGGADTTVAYSGLTEGSVGLFQINFILPSTLPAGSGTPLTLPLVISLPGNSSPPVNLYVSM